MPGGTAQLTPVAGTDQDTIADADASGMWPGKVVTKISEAGSFWEAEDEDQNYLQHYPDGKNQFGP